ncbi:MAG: hypothetical protein HPY79_05330 [Bacteroidales bacterium]|nr:hypothetical protein [Bacteroidales bacterium]
MKKIIKKTLSYLYILIITLSLLELTSYVILRFTNSHILTFPLFNRTLSPYYVFGNSPYYKFTNTIKTNKTENDLVINQYGFIAEPPLNIEKDSNTLRIALFGGSAAFGNGQSEAYCIVKKYPSGVYSYESSIAGQLKRLLEKSFPQKKIEVINATGVQRMVHQSVIYYMETISQFKPDIVISLDGMNDITDFLGISPYTKCALQFDSYINLYQISKALQDKSISNTINLLNVIRFRNIKKTVKKESNENLKYYYGYQHNKILNNDYQKYKHLFLNNSFLFEKQVLFFNAVCKTNQSTFIFGLQPLLHRTINKQLSPVEQLFQSNISPINVRMHFSSLNIRQIEQIETLISLEIKYFFDDYLSVQMEQLAQKNNFMFIDFNKEIQNIPKNTEFYTDYCHLTQEGNKIVASILVNKIKAILTVKINEHNE